MTLIRIAIVDDSNVFRRCLRELLEKEHDFSVVGEAEDGLSAVEAVSRHQPDVVLIDISMPLMDGLEATRIIKKRFPRIKVIILSMHSSDGYKESAQEAGASLYLPKDCHSKKIVEAVKAIHCSI